MGTAPITLRLKGGCSTSELMAQKEVAAFQWCRRTIDKSFNYSANFQINLYAVFRFPFATSDIC